MQIELRAAGLNDVDAITTLWHTGWIDAHDGRVPAALLAHRDQGSFRARVPVRLDTTTLALSDGRLAGFVMTHEDEIEQSTSTAASEAPALPAPAPHGEAVIGATFDGAWLAVVEGNDRARRFYERSGWTDARARSPPRRGPRPAPPRSPCRPAATRRRLAPDDATAGTVLAGESTDRGSPA